VLVLDGFLVVLVICCLVDVRGVLVLNGFLVVLVICCLVDVGTKLDGFLVVLVVCCLVDVGTVFDGFLTVVDVLNVEVVDCFVLLKVVVVKGCVTAGRILWMKLSSSFLKHSLM